MHNAGVGRGSAVRSGAKRSAHSTTASARVAQAAPRSVCAGRRVSGRNRPAGRGRVACRWPSRASARGPRSSGGAVRRGRRGRRSCGPIDGDGPWLGRPGCWPTTAALVRRPRRRSARPRRRLQPPVIWCSAATGSVSCRLVSHPILPCCCWSMPSAVSPPVTRRWPVTCPMDSEGLTPRCDSSTSVGCQ